MKVRTTTVWIGLVLLFTFLLCAGSLGYTLANSPTQARIVNGPQGFVSPGALEDSAPSRLEGQSATLLGDGRWLLLGGKDEEGRVLDNARLYEPKTKTFSELAALNLPRSGHAAWQAADGSIWVFGGSDTEGSALDTVERYSLDEEGLRFDDLAFLEPRLNPVAIPLENGSVMLAGGSDGESLPWVDALHYDPVFGTHATLNAKLSVPRHNARGALLADGNVLLWGGVDDEGKPISGGDLYVVTYQRFTALDEAAVYEHLARLADSGHAPAVAASMPVDGALDVALDRPVSLRFTHRLDPASLNREAVSLSGPHGQVEADITPSEGGLLLYVQPRADFLPGADYTLLVRGAKDRQGRELPFTTLHFKTRTLDLPGANPAGAGSRPGGVTPMLLN